MIRKRFLQRRTLRLAAAVLSLGISVPAIGNAHSTTTNGFIDTFDSYPAGPLPGSLPSDGYEIKSGIWKVEQQMATDAPATQDTNQILVQQSKATTAANGIEPIVFVRARPFRSFTAQVTAAMLDPQNALGDVNNASSVGIVFRSPLSDGLADNDNMYLFSAEVPGVSRDFPTGKVYMLHKRMGRTYYTVTSSLASTWADFTKPHDFKVVVTLGHIQCFVDGRLVIEHTDVPSPDQPTNADPLPGLPYDNGAVGMRTSGTRAWFDNFKVIGNDAYEGRANVFDAYTNYGATGSGGPQGGLRRGGTVFLSHDLGRQGSDPFDTGFVYHDHAPFEDQVVSPIVNPGSGQPAAGVMIGTTGSNGTVNSFVRLSGVNLSFSEPTNKITVIFTADSIAMTASASCSSFSSDMNFYNAVIYVRVASADKGPDTIIGPIPLALTYRPNSVILDKPGVVRVTAHARLASAPPNRVDATALKIVFPEGQTILQAQNVGVAGTPANTRTPETTFQNPPFELTLAEVVAGRYCP